MQRHQSADTSERERHLIARALAPPESSAVRDLIDAVNALSDEPVPANIDRYLAASRALEDMRRAA